MAPAVAADDVELTTGDPTVRAGEEARQPEAAPAPKAVPGAAGGADGAAEPGHTAES